MCRVAKGVRSLCELETDDSFSFTLRRSWVKSVLYRTDCPVRSDTYIMYDEANQSAF